MSLGACLALHDKKVLLVDHDPQGHSTKAFGYYDSSQYFLSMRDVILSVIKDMPIDKEQLILHSDENVDIVRTNISLASINATLESAMCRETVVERFCINALKQMEDRGFDLYVSISILSVYLGHKHLHETEYYFRMLKSEGEKVSNEAQQYINLLYDNNEEYYNGE